MAGQILEALLLATHTRTHLQTGTHAHTPIHAADGRLSDPNLLQGPAVRPCPRQPGPAGLGKEAGMRLDLGSAPSTSWTSEHRAGATLQAPSPTALGLRSCSGQEQWQRPQDRACAGSSPFRCAAGAPSWPCSPGLTCPRRPAVPSPTDALRFAVPPWAARERDSACDHTWPS